MLQCDAATVTTRHAMYNKLFTKILDSSIWLAPDPVRLVWITLIAAMDEDGNCMFACAANVAARARVTVEQAEQALSDFAAPDRNSGDPENEGRRIERIPGGWHLLNAHKYRAMVTKAIIREQTRQRTAKYRQRDASVTQGDANNLKCDAPVTPSRALAKAEERKDHTHTAGAALPEKFALPKLFGDWALVECSHWTTDTVRKIAEQFSDHHRAAGTLSLDWSATWRKWCRDPLTLKAYPPPKATVAPAVGKPEYALTVPSRAAGDTARYLAQQAEDAAESQRQRLARQQAKEPAA